MNSDNSSVPFIPVSAADVRACMRGDVYGEAETMTDAWFADHVARNDIDLERSPRYTVDGALSACALLGFRGDRAWVGGFGVLPASRGHGMGGVCVADMVRIAREAGATTLELEVPERNLGAIRLYERGGFETFDELVMWRRAPSGDDDPVVGDDGPRDAAAVAAIARDPATCWQREPRSVAAAAPFDTVRIGVTAPPLAYAFVRIGGAGGDVVLDAGLRAAGASLGLLLLLDMRFPAHTLTLLNEPAHGLLHEALSESSSWNAVMRQRRMRTALR
jgi:ribosomal protein S18 acetylase RimI-like enzyme